MVNLSIDFWLNLSYIHAIIGFDNHYQTLLKFQHLEPTLDGCIISETPAVLIGDKAYDLGPLDASLRYRGIEMVAPHKKNRKRAVTQDGRRLRR